MKPTTALVQGAPTEAVLTSLERLVHTGLVEEVVLVCPPDGPAAVEEVAEVSVQVVRTPHPGSARVVRDLLGRVHTPYLLVVDPGGGLDPVPQGLERLVGVARSCSAVLAYADYLEQRGDQLVSHPLADYQEGSLGDAFDLGPLACWSTGLLRRAMRRLGPPPHDLSWHAWYDLRLKGSAEAPVVRLPEPIATRHQADGRSSGQAVFDYLLSDRAVQREAEQVVTEHLRRSGALLRGPFLPFFSGARFPVEASVVIPVRDRVGTVADAVHSALTQQADFPFNVIAVDNHSSDGTTALLRDLASRDPRLVHRVPERLDLGIGGCWNEAVFHPACGRYAIQLDSDDLYARPDVLSRLVATLREGQCGMVIGSYSTVDFDLNPVAPGLIAHREWTDDNGPNNALRVNGLGAPRAFSTELARLNPFPNVSYGEDYAVALRLCREYRVGRIYDSLYHCRRWEQNTDSDLSPSMVARHQTYKDRVRTVEIAARRLLNHSDEGAA